MKQNVVKYAALVLSVAACAVLSHLLWQVPFFATLERKTLDWRIRFRTPDKTFGTGVAVVLLDEATMKQQPFRSPVPRQMLAKLITIVSDSGARFIGLDVFLKDPSIPADDAALAAALKASGRVVLVSELAKTGKGYRHDVPLEMFASAAYQVGLAKFPADQGDNRIRQLQPFFTADGQQVPTLTARILLLIRNQPPDAGPAAFQALVPRLRLDRDGRAFINYQAPPSTAPGDRNVITVLPASAVLTGFVPAEWFRDKIIFIGAGYEDNTDSYPTAFFTYRHNYALTPGVEIHANAMATLLQGRSIRALSVPGSMVLVLLAALFLLAIENRFSTLVAGIVLLLGCSVYTAVSLACFEHRNLALPILPFWTAMLASFVVLTVYRSLTEGRQKRWIKNAFQMYLSPEYVSQLLKDPKRLNLGGEEKELTILFSDIKGFTTLSEIMRPTDLVPFLNEYFEGMTRIILNHGGTLDKYVGDAIMAFWGAPLEQKDHAANAVRAALDMQVCTEDLNARLRKAGKPEIFTRIGLHTARVVVGNIGSRTRINYTAIGDGVNLASRLEGANKQYDSTLMMSEDTFTMAGDICRVRDLDLLQVKGKQKPVKVYEILGPRDPDLPPATREMLELYHQGLAHYRDRQWQKALAEFEAALRAKPDDGPSKVYAERCRNFMEEPPPDDWDGVFVMKTK